MLPNDYIQRLRSIEVRARLVSEQLMGGRMGSVFKGRGMDFADVREYVPGDDVRRIDWNVTARLRKPFIKRHIEERELVVMLLVDLSASGEFGSAVLICCAPQRAISSASGTILWTISAPTQGRGHSNVPSVASPSPRRRT